MTTTPKAWPPGVTLRSEAPPEAAPIKVFIVVIETGHCDDVEQKIGACYTNEYLAVEEVERLRASHWDADAYLVEREIPFPKCAIVLDTDPSVRYNVNMTHGKENTSDKTLGAVAKEAFEDNGGYGKQWVSWEAAAQAVRVAVEDDLPRDPMLLIKEAAVIWAAEREAELQKGDGVGPRGFETVFDMDTGLSAAFIRAVEALQEARK